MGQLAEIVKTSTDDVEEQLSMLSSLATAKLDLFKAEIESSLKTGKVTDDLTVAVTKIIKKHEEYRVYTGDESTLPSQIGEAVKEIIGGDTVDGVTKIAENVINVLLGAEEGEEVMEKDYIVTVEYPAIVRLDMAFWSWKVKSTKLKEKAKSIICCVVYKSSVDVSKLDFNAFLSVYAPTLRAECIDETTDKIKDENKLVKLLNEAKVVYTLLSSDPKEELPENNAVIKYLTKNGK